MVSEDVDGATEASAGAFGVELSDPAVDPRWRVRLRHCLATDPGGAFVAEQAGRVVGAAQAIRRDGVWILSLLAVDPQTQSRGVGRALFAAALDYRRPGDAGLIISSSDARAIALYGLAGFELRPSFEARGTVDRRAVPRTLPELGDGAGDLEQLGEISRRLRGATHVRELAIVLARGARVLHLRERGYAVVLPGESVFLLAAYDEEAATALLWQALAAVGDGQQAGSEHAILRWITAEQQWAVRVALRAGLRLHSYGAVCVSGLDAPLRPYLPSPPFG